MSERYDVLYLHVPKFSSYYRPFDEYMFINYISMGLFALADLTERAGLRSRILHLGVEWIADRGFSILDYIEKTKPSVVAVPIFWHPQTYDAVEVIKAVKKRFPEIFVMSGGFTASYFGAETMEFVPQIDALVVGHGDRSVADIAGRVVECRRSTPALLDFSEKLDLSNIPNLLWRRGASREIVTNAERYFPGRADLDSLNYSNMSLLSNLEIYSRSFRMNVAYSKRLTREDNLRLTPIKAGHIPLFVGHGCPVECKLCAGRNLNQRRVNGSGEVVMRSPEKVCESIVEFKKYGFEQMVVCYDPFPGRPGYFLDLFRLIREKNIETGMYFESYGLPSPEFVEDFKATFPGDDSAIAISVESGSESVREKIRGYHFTDSELFASLDHMQSRGVNFLVFFTIANPFERASDLEKTAAMIARIKNDYGRARWITTYPVQIEPGSAVFEAPERFGIEKTLFTFADYYKFHGSAGSCLYTSLGYSINDYFSDGLRGATPADRVAEFSERISALRCEKFCVLHPDASVGRAYCERFYEKYREMGFGSPDKVDKNGLVSAE